MIIFFFFFGDKYIIYNYEFDNQTSQKIMYYLASLPLSVLFIRKIYIHFILPLVSSSSSSSSFPLHSSSSNHIKSNKLAQSNLLCNSALFSFWTWQQGGQEKFYTNLNQRALALALLNNYDSFHYLGFPTSPSLIASPVCHASSWGEGRRSWLG